MLEADAAALEEADEACELMLDETEETVSLPWTARTKGTTARRVLGCIVGYEGAAVVL